VTGEDYSIPAGHKGVLVERPLDGTQSADGRGKVMQAIKCASVDGRIGEGRV